MKGFRRRRGSEAGFTLIELMISLVMFALAIAGVLGVAVSMVQGYRESRMVMAAENSVRVPMEFIADALRQTSPGVSTGNIQDTGGTCTTSALTVSSVSGPDTLDVIYAAGSVVTSSRTDYTAATPTSLDVADASQLVAGDFVVITDLNQGHLLEIASIAGNVLTLVSPACAITLPTGGYLAGSIVVRARHATFSIGTVDGIPALMFDPDATGPSPAEPLAEGVEDFQVAIGIDFTGVAGTIDELGAGADDDDWVYNVAGDTYPVTGTPRALRVTLVARTGWVPGVTGSFFRPDVEDRAAGAADGLRRRILRSTIELRNLGGSP